MSEINLRVEDYSKLKKLHDEIIQLMNSAGISYYNAIGVLETIKQEIFSEEDKEEEG